VAAFLGALRAEGSAVRRYRDSEVEEIVRRAADEQVAHPTGEGMSLATVQQIADEVGISPQRVERAARGLEVRTPVASPAESGPGVQYLGSPTVIAWERVVDGEVTASAYDDIVAEIQATLATQGTTDTLGRSLTWRATKPVLGKRRAVQVHVTSRSGQTHIQVQERLGELAVSLYGGIVVGGGIGGIATILAMGIGWLGYPLEAGLLSAVWLPGMYALTRKIFREVARRKRTDLQELSDRIAAIVTESAPGRLAGDPASEPPTG
jgi:hypothetical protein